MRALNLSWITTLTLSLVLPVISSSLIPRNQVCANDGKTEAGNIFHSRALPDPLRPRAPFPVNLPCIWCAAASAIYLKITYFNGGEPGNGINPSVIKMLSDTIDLLDAHIANYGDGVIPHGAFDHQAMGFSWYSVNVNNHQQTWGVVAHAVDALLTFMLNYQSYGMAQFLIFDGENQVGTGTLGRALVGGE